MKEKRAKISKIFLEKNIMSFAKTHYANVYKLYFPVRLDQTTRIYSHTTYFNYQ